MKKIIIGFVLFFFLIHTSLIALIEYEIEVSHNDELFIINGEIYEATTYCFNMEAGDKILFIEGSAYGACASAKLLNLRTKRICRVWCE